MNIEGMESGLLTMEQVARLLGVSRSTLRRWEQKGFIKAYRVGPRRDRRYAPEHVAKVLRMAAVGTGSE